MSKSNSFENSLLLLLFNNTDIANIGDAAGLQNSLAAGSLFVALHTADPGEAGDQTTSEIAYTGYARVGVARSGAGWTVSGNSVSNAAAVTFGKRTDIGTAVATHFVVGAESAGATKIQREGALRTSGQGPFTGAVDANITVPGHTFSVDDRCAFFPAFGSTLPTGITEGTLYWVKTSATDVITISATQGGAAVNITAVGDGVAFKAMTLSVTQNVTPEFAIGQLVINE